MEYTKNTSLLIMVFFLTINSFAQSLPKLEVGDKVLNIVGLTENGDTINLKDYRGKTILLNFTATYCGPCWKTYPLMDEMQEKYGDKLKVISVHFDEKIREWYKIANRMDIEFESTTIWVIKNKSAIFEAYQVDGFPYFYIIDREGIIREKWFGNRKRKMARYLKRQVES